MSNLSKADRDKLPASAFALPSARLYPILDQDDVDSAARLIGKHPNAKAGVIRLAKAKGLKIPDAWKTADMSIGSEFVIKRGKLFTAGDYPDKDFSITPEEMALAVEAFTQKPVRDTHPDSLLQGKMGHVQSIALDPDNPYDLIGDVAIPRWLDEALAGTAISVSAEWNRTTKQLEGLALVTDPRIEDAAIFSAYADFARRHDTPHGQMAVQELHDVAAQRGAVCRAPTANMASRHEASGIQAIHDTAVDHGATCATTSNRGAMPWFSGGKVMSWTEKLKSWVSGGMEGEAPLPEPVVSAPPVGFSAGTVAAIATPDPELAALKARVAATEAENIRLRQEGIAERAGAFYAAEFAAHRVVPAEEEAVIAAFTQAATDDATHGVVTFSAGVTKSRVDLLKAQYAVRPAHVLTQEMISAAGVTEADARALFNQQVTARAGAEKPLTPERKSELLAMTPLGQATLSGRQN